jgi:sterol 3beta-glucosyltransferase
LGTPGDVQPFVALAQHLEQRGHEAVVAAPHRFTDLAESHGVTFAGIDDGPLRLLETALRSVMSPPVASVRSRH